MADRRPARRCSTGKRRVDGIELAARRAASRRTGTSTAASPSWTARSSRAAANVQGKTPLGVPDVAGNIWTVYRLPRRLRGRRRRARPVGHLAHRRQHRRRCRATASWDCTAAYVQREVRAAAQRQQRHRQDLLHRRLQQQPEPRAAGRAARRVGHVALQLPSRTDAAARFPSVLDADAGRARSARASTPRAGSTATSPPGHQSARAKYNEQLPEDSSEARELGEEILAALARSPLFFSAALPKQVFPPLFNRYGPGMTFGNHVDSAIRAHAPTGRAHPHRHLGDAVPDGARRLRRRRAAGRGHATACTA